MEIKYDKEEGIRVDKFLREKIEVSRERVKKLIEEGKILLNEKKKLSPLIYLKKMML